MYCLSKFGRLNPVLDFSDKWENADSKNNDKMFLHKNK